nr:MAG TPA: hypothetical protein [Caudoviricetes sp.]
MQFLVPFEELLVRAGRELRVDLLTELIVHQRNIRFKFTIGHFSFTSVVFFVVFLPVAVCYLCVSTKSSCF